MKRKRKIYLVDRSVQLKIAGRVAIYWLAAQLFVILPLAFYRTFTEGGILTNNIAEICLQYWPVFAMFLMFLPLAAYDSIRLSNRFAGPIYRLRTELKRRESGEKIGPIKFRDGDHYSDLPDSINALIQQVDDLEAVVATELQHEAS